MWFPKVTMETFSFQAIISKGTICIKMTELDFFGEGGGGDSREVMPVCLIAIISKLVNVNI